MSFLGKIKGLVAGVTSKLRMGGRRRSSQTKKGRGYLLRTRPMVPAPTPASKEPRRRRKTKKAKKN
jgi:hypothetical protein